MKPRAIPREIAADFPLPLAGAICLALTAALGFGLTLAIAETHRDPVFGFIMALFIPIIAGLAYLSIDMLTGFRLSRLLARFR